VLVLAARVGALIQAVVVAVVAVAQLAYAQCVFLHFHQPFLLRLRGQRRGQTFLGLEVLVALQVLARI
jgi:hypothetical protein